MITHSSTSKGKNYRSWETEELSDEWHDALPLKALSLPIENNNNIASPFNSPKDATGTVCIKFEPQNETSDMPKSPIKNNTRIPQHHSSVMSPSSKHGQFSERPCHSTSHFHQNPPWKNSQLKDIFTPMTLEKLFTNDASKNEGTSESNKKVLAAIGEDTQVTEAIENLEKSKLEKQGKEAFFESNESMMMDNEQENMFYKDENFNENIVLDSKLYYSASGINRASHSSDSSDAHIFQSTGPAHSKYNTANEKRLRELVGELCERLPRAENPSFSPSESVEGSIESMPYHVREPSSNYPSEIYDTNYKPKGQLKFSVASSGYPSNIDDVDDVPVTPLDTKKNFRLCDSNALRVSELVEGNKNEIRRKESQQAKMNDAMTAYEPNDLINLLGAELVKQQSNVKSRLAISQSTAKSSKHESLYIGESPHTRKPFSEIQVEDANKRKPTSTRNAYAVGQDQKENKWEIEQEDEEKLYKILKSLKYEVSEWNTIESLDLSNSNIEYLTNLKEHFPNVLYMTLDNNRIRELKYLPKKLVTLSFRSNLVSQIDISGIPKIQIIDGSHNQIHSVDISNLFELKEILLNHNRLKGSLHLFNMTVSHVSLTGNDLSSVFLECSENLQVAELSHNCISFFKANHLPYLRKLILGSNPISNLEVDQCNDLEELDLTGSALKFLDLSKLEMLRTLTLNNSSPDLTFICPKSLKTLNFDLKERSFSKTRMKALNFLEQLSLYNHMITESQIDDLESFSNLTLLNLNNCLIEFLPHDFPLWLSSLKNLDLSDNKLCNIWCFNDFKNLNFLNLKNNNLNSECLKYLPLNLKMLDLRGNKFTKHFYPIQSPSNERPNRLLAFCKGDWKIQDELYQKHEMDDKLLCKRIVYRTFIIYKISSITELDGLDVTIDDQQQAEKRFKRLQRKDLKRQKEKGKKSKTEKLKPEKPLKAEYTFEGDNTVIRKTNEDIEALQKIHEQIDILQAKKERSEGSVGGGSNVDIAILNPQAARIRSTSFWVHLNKEMANEEEYSNENAIEVGIPSTDKQEIYDALKFIKEKVENL